MHASRVISSCLRVLGWRQLDFLMAVLAGDSGPAIELRNIWFWKASGTGP